MRTMLNTLRILLSIRNTININGILHGIRSIPFVGKYIPERIYGIRVIKILTLLVSLSIELCKAFFGKICLFLFLYFLSGAAGSVNDYSQSTLFLYGFTGILLLGMLSFNIFHVDTETKYAVFFMGMDAKKYIHARFLYVVINVLIGYTIWGIPAALLAGVKWYLAILIPVAGVGYKALTLGLRMAVYAGKQKRGKVASRKGVPVSVSGNLVAESLLFAGILLAGLFLAMPVARYNVYQPGIILLIAGVLFTVPGFLLIRKFPHSLYRKALFAEQKRDEITKETADRQRGKNKEVAISETKEIKSGSSGYKYLNEIFIKRHRKIFLGRLIFTVIGTIITIALAAFFLRFELKLGRPDESILRFLFTKHPGLFLPILLAINSGAYMSHAMFANCDSALLMFGFYRTPNALKKMFWLRLKSIVLFNLIPAGLTAVFAVLVIILTGGESFPLQSVFTIAEIFLCVVFCSAWHLTIYYLLQPYAKDLLVKSKLYGFLSFLVGLVSFIVFFPPFNSLILTLAGIVFTGLFLLLANLLVGKISPKTFRVK